MIAPHFLNQADLEAVFSSPNTLRWPGNGWSAGEPATGPEQISSFAAMDAILERLADRRRFPHLPHVVVAGHSGGGQLVQRYAIAGRIEPALLREGIDVRYVVMNPSSYAYFDSWHPDVDLRVRPDCLVRSARVRHGAALGGRCSAHKSPGGKYTGVLVSSRGRI